MKQLGQSFTAILCLAVFLLVFPNTTRAGWELQSPIPSENNLNGVWGSSGSDVFAVGGGAEEDTILHYGGSEWSSIYSSTNGPLYGVWGSSGTDVFAVGEGMEEGTILHYGGSEWLSMYSGTSDPLYGVWGSSGTDVFAVGYYGTIVHYDGGTSWSSMASSTMATLYGVWGSSGTDVFAVGSGGTIVRYVGGTSWSSMTSGTGVTLYGVWGSSGSDVFAVGSGGTILHYDGSNWLIMTSGTSAHLNSVWGSSNIDVFAVGDGGTVLHYTPDPPTVTTTVVSSITSNSATSGGNVTDDGGSSVTERGVCWSTTSDPTTSDDLTTDGTGTGAFTSLITGLDPGATYHVRAYATNGQGTSYGSDRTFSTPLSAGTYYINIQSGNDSNNGSSGSPWKTLHHAVSQINGRGGRAPYLLYVSPGTYSVANGEEDIGLTISQDSVTVVKDGSGTVLISGSGASNWNMGIEIDASFVTLNGLAVSDFSLSGIKISSGTGSIIEKCKINGNLFGIRFALLSSGGTVRGCDIYQNGASGVDILRSTGASVIWNTIHDNSTSGLAVRGCSPTINRNMIYDNKNGISVMAHVNAETSPAIKNNVIYQETSGEVDYGILVSSNESALVSPIIYHNTIDGGRYSGISVERDGAGTASPEIKFNIITNFGQHGIANSGGAPHIDYNDVWDNGSGNYSGCSAGPNDISLDPLFASYSLQSASPCRDAIGTGAGDPVVIDYLGYSRPKGSGYDMGAYEFIPPVTYNYTLPGGTGLSTDYRIFAVPLDLGTGSNMLADMENELGPYDPNRWRVFAYVNGAFIEMNRYGFASLSIRPSMGFWIISSFIDTIPFEGAICPDGISYEKELPPGWSLFSLPWTDTDINLGNISVSDGVNECAITCSSNTLTQRCIWDYTGSGPHSGYERRESDTFTLKNGTGFFINVLVDSPVKLIIPPNNGSASRGYDQDTDDPGSTGGVIEEPPPPPGSPQTPVPDIRANGQGGPVTVSSQTPVSIAITLDPGDRAGENADWWVAVQTPFAPPNDWYAYVHLIGWRPGLQASAQIPLGSLSTPFEVLGMTLPVGEYTFYFAVDENSDGIADATWLDAVDVRVE